MGGLLTSEQKNTQEIDPMLRAESEALLNLFRSLAAQPHEVNRNVNVAAFTPKQQAAFDMADDASAAFGFGRPARTEMPQTQTSALGIKGYSTAAEYDKSKSMLSPEYKQWREAFQKQAATPTPHQEPLSSGGKK